MTVSPSVDVVEEFPVDAEGRFRSLVDAMHEGLVVQTEDGIIEANPAACEMLGLTMDQLLGRTSVDPRWRAVREDGNDFHGDDHPAMLALRDGAIVEGAVMGVHRPAGDLVWLLINAVPMRDAAGDVVAAVTTFADITAFRALQEELRDSTQRSVELVAQAHRDEDRWRLIMTDAPIGMVLVGLDGLMQTVNQALCRITGYAAEDLLDQPFHDLAHPEEIDVDLEQINQLLAGNLDHYELEKRYLRCDGSTLWTMLSVSLVRREDGRPAHFIAQLQDISDAKRAQEQLAYRALHDALTGMPNRVLVLERLEQALVGDVDGGVAVLFCDLDHFKVINDSLGHEVGDVFLIGVGERLTTSVGPGATVGRMGGDEFVVVAPGLADDEAAAALADRVHRTVIQPLEVNGHVLTPSVSVGIARNTGGATASSLLRDADTALYRAKERGRGRYVLFDAAMRQAALSRLEVETDLREALATDQLVAHFQPMDDLRDGTRIGYEALVRWQHPRRGLLLPADFIGVAEESGLMTEIGARLIDRACAFVAAHPHGVHGPMRIAVKVSALQLGGAAILPVLERAITEHGIVPDQLVLGLTEASLFGASSAVLNQIRAISDLGVGFVVDDFGQGYGAIAALRSLPIAGVKLHRSLVTGMDVDRSDGCIVQALAALVDALGLIGIADGVQTAGQAEALAAMGWTHLQGPLVGGAAPAEAWLADACAPEWCADHAATG